VSEPARETELQFLLEVIRSVSGGETGAAPLQRLVELVRARWEAEAVSIARVEPGGAVTFCAAGGGSAEQIIGLRLASGTGVVGWVATHGEPLWIPDVTVDARFYPSIDRRTGFNTRSILAVPLLSDGAVSGVLEFINPAAGDDVGDYSDLLEAVALLAAPILHSAGLSQRLQSVESQYQRLFDLNLDPIVVLSRGGRLVEVNGAAQRLLGLGAEEPPEFNLIQLGIPPATYRDLRRQARHQGVVTWEYTLPGRDRAMEARLMPLPDYQPDGGYMWIGHDITQQVDQARARQELMQMVVHDLRTPLGSIQNSLELVLTAWRDQDATMPIEQILGIGLRMAHRMEQLISDILDSARLSSNERALHIVETDVGMMVDDALEVVSSSAERRRQTVTVDVDPAVKTLNCDANLLRRVLVNLLSNAVKFNHDGGHIKLTVEQDDDEMRFSVEDDGPGIGPELREHVFELFVRGETRRTKGTGIGLAFCKLAVEAHGGRIWVESELDEGACFTFTIPRRLQLSPTMSREGDDTPTHHL